MAATTSTSKSCNWSKYTITTHCSYNATITSCTPSSTSTYSYCIIITRNYSNNTRSYTTSTTTTGSSTSSKSIFTAAAASSNN